MLRVTNISFAYNKPMVLNNISFNLGIGEHVSIIGESGCGKSTLLKLIYGLLEPVEGAIYWGNTQVLGPNYNLVPGESYMKYLSQDFDLMPHTTVAENIGQYLSVFQPEALKARTSELLEMIEMEHLGTTKVKYLSGGQQQRVALARVLAQEPKLLLLDEPFGHIDNFRKNSLRRNLFAYLKYREISCIVATHDHNDILPFADKVIVLKEGNVLAKDAPHELYDNPKSLYVASLFDEANHIPINIVKSYADTKRRIIVYASEFRVSGKSGLPVTVTRSYYMGSHYMVEGIYEDRKIYFHSPSPLPKEKEVFLNVSLETINRRLTHNPIEVA